MVHPVHGTPGSALPKSQKNPPQQIHAGSTYHNLTSTKKKSVQF